MKYLFVACATDGKEKMRVKISCSWPWQYLSFFLYNRLSFFPCIATQPYFSPDKLPISNLFVREVVDDGELGADNVTDQNVLPVGLQVYKFASEAKEHILGIFGCFIYFLSIYSSILVSVYFF